VNALRSKRGQEPLFGCIRALHSRIPKRDSRPLFLLLLAVVAGCSGGREPTYPAEGTVTFEGKSLAGATILFRPAQGPVATGKLDEQGNFRLSTYGDGDGAVAGEHAVRLVMPDKTFDVSPDELEFTTDFETLRQEPPFPSRYLAFETSGLTAVVKEDENHFEFTLEP